LAHRLAREDGTLQEMCRHGIHVSRAREQRLELPMQAACAVALFWHHTDVRMSYKGPSKGLQ